MGGYPKTSAPEGTSDLVEVTETMKSAGAAVIVKALQESRLSVPEIAEQVFHAMMRDESTEYVITALGNMMVRPREISRENS